MGQVVLRLPQEPFVMGDGAGNLVPFPAQGEYCDCFNHPRNIGISGIRFLWRLRQYIGTGWLWTQCTANRSLGGFPRKQGKIQGKIGKMGRQDLSMVKKRSISRHFTRFSGFG